MEDYIEVDSSELEVGDFIRRDDSEYGDGDELIFMEGKIVSLNYSGDEVEILLSEPYESDFAGEITDRCLSVGVWYRRLSNIGKKRYPRIKTKFLEGFQL